MKPRNLLKELEQVAAQVDLSVRTQPFRNTALQPGGLCKLRGRSVVLLNSRTHADDRALVLAEVLNTLDIDHVEMSEDAREFLAARQSRRTNGNARRGSSPRGADTPRGPGLRRTRPRLD